MIIDRPMFLPRAEVAELTGAKLRRRQISVLVRNGIRHTINAAGWPMVARAAVETGSPDVSATIVQTFRKPAGAWVVLRGAANGTARIVLFDAAKFPKVQQDIPARSVK